MHARTRQCLREDVQVTDGIDFGLPLGMNDIVWDEKPESFNGSLSSSTLQRLVAAPLEWLREQTCPHEDVRRFERKRMWLECLRCGRVTVGVQCGGNEHFSR